MSDALLTQRDRAGQLAARGRLDAALAEFQRLEREGRREEAAAGYEGLAVAWAQGSQLLRALVACKELLRLEPQHTRTQAVIVSLYTRPDRLPVPLLAKLEKDAFVALLEGLEVRTFDVGEPVVREGEPGASMFFLVEGRADVMCKREGDTQQVLVSVGEGGAFGELSLIAEGPRLASVVPTTPSVLLELTRARLLEVSARYPSAEQVVHLFYRERAVDNLLRTHTMFSLLRPEQKQAVAREFKLQRVEAGQTLLTAGEAGEAFFLLLRGQCTPYHVHPDGHETPYPVLREGDVFGEISLLLDKPVTATVRTDVPCVLLRLDRAACERHILHQPGMRGTLMEMGAERLRRTARVLSERALH